MLTSRSTRSKRLDTCIHLLCCSWDLFILGFSVLLNYWSEECFKGQRKWGASAGSVGVVRNITLNS